VSSQPAPPGTATSGDARTCARVAYVGRLRRRRRLIRLTGLARSRGGRRGPRSALFDVLPCETARERGGAAGTTRASSDLDGLGNSVYVPGSARIGAALSAGLIAANGADDPVSSRGRDRARTSRRETRWRNRPIRTGDDVRTVVDSGAAHKSAVLFVQAAGHLCATIFNRALAVDAVTDRREERSRRRGRQTGRALPQSDNRGHVRDRAAGALIGATGRRDRRDRTACSAGRAPGAQQTSSVPLARRSRRRRWRSRRSCLGTGGALLAPPAVEIVESAGPVPKQSCQ
jgi:hypothetical protein